MNRAGSRGKTKKVIIAFWQPLQCLGLPRVNGVVLQCLDNVGLQGGTDETRHYSLLGNPYSVWGCLRVNGVVLQCLDNVGLRGGPRDENSISLHGGRPGEWIIAATTVSDYHGGGD